MTDFQGWITCQGCQVQLCYFRARFNSSNSYWNLTELMKREVGDYISFIMYQITIVRVHFYQQSLNRQLCVVMLCIILLNNSILSYNFLDYRRLRFDSCPYSKHISRLLLCICLTLIQKRQNRRDHHQINFASSGHL